VASDIKNNHQPVHQPPGYLQLFAKPDAPGPTNPRLGALDTATAGQNFNPLRHVFDSLYNWVPANDSKVTWTMHDTMGNPILSTTLGSSTGFTLPKPTAGP